ncbi:hypothetical protein HPB51_013341 [Rhipicephalus microplus]|uniref:Uncharacterized protein n=1 Tax=Rhipicephalus microplus TaxID=6941 RepID=A0A9J6ETN2_RHIMP|nr:hypothetical protein HPB51_013341 [Rhipicephalus microplus]
MADVPWIWRRPRMALSCGKSSALCQQQECDPVPVLRCYGGLLSTIETELDKLAAKYGTELDAALRTFASKYPVSYSPCKIRPGEQGRCTPAEREQLERIEGVYEVFQRTVSDSDALRDMVAAYKCWDRRKYRDCFASLLQDTLIREYRDSSYQETRPEKTRICRQVLRDACIAPLASPVLIQFKAVQKAHDAAVRLGLPAPTQWSRLADSCFEDTSGGLCAESATAGRQHFRDVMSAYVGSFGCPNSAGMPGRSLLLTSTAVGFAVWMMTRRGF